MTSKELKITMCWPRTLMYNISPRIFRYQTVFVTKGHLGNENLTISPTPLIINEPGFVNRHIEKVTD